MFALGNGDDNKSRFLFVVMNGLHGYSWDCFTLGDDRLNWYLDDIKPMNLGAAPVGVQWQLWVQGCIHATYICIWNWNFQYQIFVNKYWHFPNFRLVHHGQVWKKLVLAKSVIIWVLKYSQSYMLQCFPEMAHLVQYLLIWQPSHSLPCYLWALVGLKTPQMLIKLIIIIIRFLSPVQNHMKLNMHVHTLHGMRVLQSIAVEFLHHFAHLIVWSRCRGTERIWGIINRAWL